MSHNEEHIIIMGVVSGEHNAFRALFIKYYPKVNYFITHFIKSEEVAEELSQDIFLKIWENRARLSNIQSLSSYLYRMAKHALINYLEHKYIEESYLATLHQPLSSGIEEELDAKELEFLVQLVVDRMPEQRRKIYKMSREEHIRNGEIASLLGITEKTVNNQLSLALKEIRKAVSLALSFFL